MEGLVVRPAVKLDAKNAFAMLAEFTMSYQPQRVAFDKWYPSILVRREVHLLMAELHGDMVGYVLATTYPTLFANEPITELLELFVKPSHREQGIGRGLVREVLQHAKPRGAAEVTAPTRRAADFYVKLGFPRTAEYLKLSLACAT